MELDLVLKLTWEELPDSIMERFAAAAQKYLEHEDMSDALVLIDIEADYTPYCPGRYDGHPDNMYPAEEADVEILGHVISLVYSPETACLDIPNESEFIGAILQYARDWLECEMQSIREQLMEKGKNMHGDEISSILAEIEAAADDERDRRRDEPDIEQQVRGIVADWADGRMKAPDES